MPSNGYINNMNNPYLGMPNMPNWYGYYNAYQNAINSLPQNNNGAMYANQQPPMQVQQNGLNGRVIESKDVLAVTEVPVGSYGVFPKTDFSEIYVKHWTTEGKPVIDVYHMDKEKAQQEQNFSLNDVMAQVSNLNSKVDSLVEAYLKPSKKEINKHE